MSAETIRKRVNDTIITITMDTDDAVIDYDDILKSVKIEPDSDSAAPWEDCDSYDHEVKKATEFPDCTKVDEMRGFFTEGNWRGRACVILVDRKWAKDNLDNGLPGMSKQVRAERLAFSIRAMIDQLQRWHDSGWKVWQTWGKFKGHTAGCGGIYDDDGEYVEEMRHQAAREIALELIDDGYTVNGLPARKKQMSNAMAHHQYIQHYMRSNYVR